MKIVVISANVFGLVWLYSWKGTYKLLFLPLLWQKTVINEIVILYNKKKLFIKTDTKKARALLKNPIERL